MNTREHLPTFVAFGKRLKLLSKKLSQFFADGPGSRWRIAAPLARESQIAKQRSLLRILAFAHKEKVDCGRLVHNLATEHSGRYRRRLRRLARRLIDGTPVVEALEQTPDVLSDASTLAIRFGSQSGTLVAVYEALLDDSMDVSADDALSKRISLTYFGGILLVFLLTMTFICIKILPVLEQIGSEFDLDTGNGLSSLVLMANAVSGMFGWFLLIVALAIPFIWTGRIQRLVRRTIASRYLRTVARHRSAQVLRLLAIAQEQGRPISGALSTLARFHYDRNTRSRLLYARNEVEQGVDAWSGLEESGLLTSCESQSLALSTSSATRSWTMRRIALIREQQAASRGQMLRELLHPLIVLLFAGVVLWCGWATMGFLTNIVLTTSGIKL